MKYNVKDGSAKIGYVIYNYNNYEEDLGFSGGLGKVFFCKTQYIGIKGCNETTLEKLIGYEKGMNGVQHGILTIGGMKNQTVDFAVPEKGYYCIVAESFGESSFTATINWGNGFGHLPAAYYPILVMSGSMALVYLAILAVWGFFSYRYWREMLRVQNYISFVMFAAMVECCFQYGYYAYYNNNGASSNALMIFMILASSFRASVSLFLLLIVSMGHGVLRPTLGKVMNKVYALTYTHFIFVTISEVGTVFIDQSQDFLVLLITLPVSVTYTVFFWWIVSSLQLTKEELKSKRQHVKLEMYTVLTRSLTIYFGLAILFMLVTMVVLVAYFGTRQWMSKNWTNLWFLSDGWPTFTYFAGLMTIAYLIRPRENNARYGLEQVSSTPPEDSDDRLDSRRDVQLEVIVDHDRDRRRSPAASVVTVEEDNWAEENLGVLSDSDDGRDAL